MLWLTVTFWVWYKPVSTILYFLPMSSPNFMTGWLKIAESVSGKVTLCIRMRLCLNGWKARSTLLVLRLPTCKVRLLRLMCKRLKWFLIIGRVSGMKGIFWTLLFLIGSSHVQSILHGVAPLPVQVWQTPSGVELCSLAELVMPRVLLALMVWAVVSWVFCRPRLFTCFLCWPRVGFAPARCLTTCARVVWFVCWNLAKFKAATLSQFNIYTTHHRAFFLVEVVE